MIAHGHDPAAVQHYPRDRVRRAVAVLEAQRRRDLRDLALAVRAALSDSNLDELFPE